MLGASSGIVSCLFVAYEELKRSELSDCREFLDGLFVAYEELKPGKYDRIA